jgi:hypothetical protein
MTEQLFDSGTAAFPQQELIWIHACKGAACCGVRREAVHFRFEGFILRKEGLPI